MDRFTRFTNRNQAKDSLQAVEMLDGVLDSVGFTAAVEKALAYGEKRAVVLIELDGGGPVGTAAEARITRTIRADDVLGRLDGGRLAVLTGMDGAARIAIRLADRLREPFHIGGEHVRLVPQVGVGYGYPDVVTAAAILFEAENSPRY